MADRTEAPRAAGGPTARATYPVTLRLAGRPCLVVGAGPVAARKASQLADAGGAVTVVASAVHPAMAAVAGTRTGSGAGTVTLEQRPYAAGEAAGFRLVVTATGEPPVDTAVAADAEAAGVWVNSADDPDNCTFTLPSIHRDGPVTIAVSTGGASPALAAWLRRRLADAAGTHLGALADLLAEARGQLKASGRPSSDVDWAALLDGPLSALVAAGDLDGARALLADELGVAVPGPASPAG